MPGSFKFFGLTVKLNECFEVILSANKKLNEIYPHLLSLKSRKNQEDVLNAIELHHYQSFNGSFNFLGINVFSMNSFFQAIYNGTLEPRNFMILPSKMLW